MRGAKVSSLLFFGFANPFVTSGLLQAVKLALAVSPLIRIVSPRAYMVRTALTSLTTYSKLGLLKAPPAEKIA